MLFPKSVAVQKNMQMLTIVCISTAQSLQLRKTSNLVKEIQQMGKQFI